MKCLSTLPSDPDILISKFNAKFIKRLQECESCSLRPGYACVTSVLEVLNPSSIHGLWIFPELLNSLCFTILSRQRSLLLLLHLFSTHILINMLGSCIIWVISLFTRDLLWLFLLMEIVDDWFNCKVGSSPWLCCVTITLLGFFLNLSIAIYKPFSGVLIHWDILGQSSMLWDKRVLFGKYLYVHILNVYITPIISIETFTFLLSVFFRPSNWRPRKQIWRNRMLFTESRWLD